jgi:hypothetical protein
MAFGFEKSHPLQTTQRMGHPDVCWSEGWATRALTMRLDADLLRWFNLESWPAALSSYDHGSVGVGMTDKIAHYRKLAQSLAELGDQYAKGITAERYRLMYHYFMRCCRLASATVLLVENGYLSAAYALQKSIVDSMLNGLHIGYAAKDPEVSQLIARASERRGTGYSRMERRAREIDEAIEKRRPHVRADFYNIVKRTREFLNEFGHGGLLSTVLEAECLPPEVGYKVLADSLLTVISFLGNVFIMENLDLSPLQQVLQEFDDKNKTTNPAPPI